jgi:hypothetical protein
MAKGVISGLGLTNGDVSILRGVDSDILAKGLIGFDGILILPRYTFFFGRSAEKNYRVMRAWPEAISRWVIDREVFPGVQK